MRCWAGPAACIATWRVGQCNHAARANGRTSGSAEGRVRGYWPGTAEQLRFKIDYRAGIDRGGPDP